MNIFVLSLDPIEAAQMQCDKHVVKMCTESAQMLSSTLLVFGFDALYKMAHKNHPQTKWTREARANYIWHYRHWVALNHEYTHRYDRVHATWEHNPLYKNACNMLPFDREDLTPFVLTMPDQYKMSDPVQSYRQFYLHEKSRFAKWNKSRTAPDWWAQAKSGVVVS